jgi:hypothetical protein
MVIALLKKSGMRSAELIDAGYKVGKVSFLDKIYSQLEKAICKRSFN